MRKKHDIKKRALAQIKGLLVEWVDTDPLKYRTEKLPGKISHKNPMMQFVAEDIFRKYGNWLMHKQRMRWIIEVRVIFRYPTGDDHRIRELQAMGTIDEMNNHVMQQIKEAMREGAEDKYLHTRLKMECLGHSAPLKFDDTEGHER